MNKLFLATTLLIVTCMVISGFYVYFEYFAYNEKPELEEVKTIDDRISPLTQQGVFLEIHRIRVNGIID